MKDLTIKATTVVAANDVQGIEMGVPTQFKSGHYRDVQHCASV